MANEFAGSATYIAWLYGAGTYAIISRYRTAQDSPSADLLDTTAGSDVYKTYLLAFKDAQFSTTFLQVSGSAAALGTALQEGNYGTLLFGVEGTALGKQKITIPAFSMGMATNPQYNQVVECSVTFQQSGTRTLGTW